MSGQDYGVQVLQSAEVGPFSERTWIYRGALLVRGCTALYLYRDGFVFQAHRLLYHST